MMFHSIRWRLQLWHGLLLLVVLTGFGLTSWRVIRDNFWTKTDAELEQLLEAVFRPPPPNGPRDRPPGPPPGKGFRDYLGGAIRDPATRQLLNNGYLVLWRGDGSVVAQSDGVPANLRMPDLARPMSGGHRLQGDNREFYRMLPFGDILLVGRSAAPELAALQRVRLSLVAAGLTVWLLGLAVGGWLTKRALRTVGVISETAEQIAAGDLSRRVQVSSSDGELDRLANVLNSTFARLEQSFQQQAQFTADASHELRTPIAVVLAQTQSALARERPAAEYRDALEACSRAAQRMRKLVESLLQLARLDARQEPATRQQVDLAAIAGECLDFVRHSAQQHGIRIVSDLQPAECLADSEQMSQVATNLFTNAVQFNRDAGEIHVATRRERDAVYLEVRNTGEGIPEDELALIFNRFYRVDKSRSRQSGRSGLGLAICKSIVDSHHGAITAANTGDGCVFTVTLPGL